MFSRVLPNLCPHFRRVLVVLAAAFVIPLQRLLHVCVSSFELFLRKSGDFRRERQDPAEVLKQRHI